MATLEQVESAFQRAHEAGDTEAAQALADEVLRLRSTQPAEAPPPMAPDQASGAPSGVVQSSGAPSSQGWPSSISSDAQEPSTGIDMVRSLGTGLRLAGEGLAGLPGDASSLASSAGAWLAGKMGASPEGVERRKQMQLFGGLPTTEDVSNATTDLIGPHHQPQTVPGEYSRTVGQFAPAALAPGGALTKAGMVLAPALTSETAGQITKGTSAEPYARLGGALAGTALPSALRRAVTPLPISQDRQAMVDALKREGVKATAGQKSGRELLKFAESELGGGKAGKLVGQQADDFTASVLRKAGIAGKKATPEVMDKGFKTVGKSFDDLAARNSITPDQTLIDDVSKIASDYKTDVADAMQAKIVQKIADDIFDKARTGTIDGKFYQSTTSQLFKKARGADADKSGALHAIRDALDDAMERSLRNNNPADLGAWRDARNKWRNILVVEKAVGGAGEAAAMGNITPAQLRAATTAVQGKRAYVRGKGDFADLARSGNAIMQPMPQSGTAARGFVRALPVGTAAIGTQAGGDALTGFALGLGAPYAAGRTLMSKPVQSYLANQAMVPKPGMMDAKTRAALAAMLARPALVPPKQ